MLANCRSNFHLFTGNVHCHKFYLLSFRLGESSIPFLMSKSVMQITYFCHFLSTLAFCEEGQERGIFYLRKWQKGAIVDGMIWH
ncbi:hypothetical protein EGM70_09565 [Enterobacteriaceae bacterium 89]|nr:hypothetical protein [Enterobacteriaceae bacterium 89]